MQLIINDRVDIALNVHADGVHVGQDELSVSEIRRVAGSQLQIGVSTHSVSQAQQAALDGADYIGIGPVFPSSTKAFEQFVGAEVVQEVIHAVSIPAFAIGGIDLDNVSKVAGIGCHRVAVSGIYSSLDPSDPQPWIDVTTRLKSLLANQ